MPDGLLPMALTERLKDAMAGVGAAPAATTVAAAKCGWCRSVPPGRNVQTKLVNQVSGKRAGEVIGVVRHVDDQIVCEVPGTNVVALIDFPGVRVLEHTDSALDIPMGPHGFHQRSESAARGRVDVFLRAGGSHDAAMAGYLGGRR